MTLRNEFANLVSECQNREYSVHYSVKTAREIDIFENKVYSIFFEIAYSNSGVQFFVCLHSYRHNEVQEWVMIDVQTLGLFSRTPATCFFATPADAFRLRIWLSSCHLKGVMLYYTDERESLCPLRHIPPPLLSEIILVSTKSMPYFLCHNLPGEAVIENGALRVIRKPETAESWLK